jgi:hypothetical protein
MLHFKSRKITLLLCLCVLSALISPILTHAEPYDTGDIASKRAAEQRAAIAKRAEKKKKEVEEQKAAEAQKEAETQKPVEIQEPTEVQKEIAPAQ